MRSSGMGPRFDFRRDGVAVQISPQAAKGMDAVANPACRMLSTETAPACAGRGGSLQKWRRSKFPGRSQARFSDSAPIAPGYDNDVPRRNISPGPESRAMLGQRNIANRLVPGSSFLRNE